MYSTHNLGSRLQGKTALVTGGAGFLGQHFCTALSSEGARVIVADVNLPKAELLSNQLTEAFQQNSFAVQCDVSSPDSVHNVLRSIEAQGLTIDVLVNNAATKTDNVDRFFDTFEDYTLQTWRSVTAVNLDGMFIVAQAVGRHMIQNSNGGSIVQVASVYGVLAPDHRIYEGSHHAGRPISSPAVYSVSKAGVIALSKYLATYWGDKGIRVNTISPGGIFSNQNNEFVSRYSDRVPMRRMGTPSDLIGALIFLASDESPYMNGQNVIVDGGLSAW